MWYSRCSNFVALDANRVCRENLCGWQLAYSTNVSKRENLLRPHRLGFIMTAADSVACLGALKKGRLEEPLDNDILKKSTT